ncbi:MAG: alpha/beta fold hydrolase [Verrucomicrobia bacterium]|nr:alpha/beta fold hydrolase [Verrucomicrobiota bacterium]
MPIVTSSFFSPPLLEGGHRQTILPVVLPRRFKSWQGQERLELPDGDFLDLSWRQNRHPRLVILSHGLEGSAGAIYIRGMADTLHRAGWDVLAWNYRSCGGIENRLMRSYHSGESGDLRTIVGHAAQSYQKIALVGFSLGGNITLKYAGESPTHSAICASIAISAPVDLASSAQVLDVDPKNRLYLQRFLRTMKAKTLLKARRFPELRERLAGRDGVAAVQTIREFDERITAPVHGFADAADYWARASSLPYLQQIQVPALLLNARNDPLLAAPSFPEALAESSTLFHLEAPANGGHVGFLDFNAGLQPWHERRVQSFLDNLDL